MNLSGRLLEVRTSSKAQPNVADGIRRPYGYCVWRDGPIGPIHRQSAGYVLRLRSGSSSDTDATGVARQGCTVVVPFREEMTKRHLKVTGDLGRVIFVVRSRSIKGWDKKSNNVDVGI